MPEPKAWAKLNEDGTPKTLPAGREAGASTTTKKTQKGKRSKPKRGVCRECGCTEETPCLTGSGPCAWTDSKKTLCTACAAKKGKTKRGSGTEG